MAQKNPIDSATIQFWHNKEWYLPENPIAIYAHGWKGNVDRSCLINDAKKDAKDFAMQHCLVAAEPGGFTTYWGARLYNIHGARIIDCEFGPVDREHTFYWESWGDNLIENVWFHDAPAQALQDAWRGQNANEGNECLDQTKCDVVGTMTLRHVRVDNCGLIAGAGRAAFGLSFFAAQGVPGNNGRRMQSVYLDDVTMAHRGDGSGMITCSNRPAFVAHGLDARYTNCVNWVWSDQTGSIHANHREAMLFHDIDHVEIVGYMEGSDIKLYNCKSIDLTKLKGNGFNQVFVDGKKVASTAAGYSH